MRRLNVIIGKKQIVIAGLALILGAAIYVSYLNSRVEPRAEIEAAAISDGENYGDVKFVSADNVGDVSAASVDKSDSDDIPDVASITSANAAASSDAELSAPTSAQGAAEKNAMTEEYFAQARLDKQQSRDEAVELLQTFATGGDAVSEELAVAAQGAVTVSKLIESESKIENLLLAQGFSEVMCYLTDNSANIIVKTNGLDAAGAAKIKNTLLSEKKIPVENITIVEIK